MRMHRRYTTGPTHPSVITSAEPPEREANPSAPMGGPHVTGRPRTMGRPLMVGRLLCLSMMLVTVGGFAPTGRALHASHATPHVAPLSALRMQQPPQPVYTEKAVVRRGTGLGPHVHAAVRVGSGFESSSCVISN